MVEKLIFCILSMIWCFHWIRICFNHGDNSSFFVFLFFSLNSFSWKFSWNWFHKKNSKISGSKTLAITNQIDMSLQITYLRKVLFAWVTFVIFLLIMNSINMSFRCQARFGRNTFGRPFLVGPNLVQHIWSGLYLVQTHIWSGTFLVQPNLVGAIFGPSKFG